MDSQCEERDCVQSSTAVAAEEDFWTEQQLKELNLEISAALEEAVKQGKDLNPYTDLLLENQREVKKTLQAHKSHLQHLVNLHYEQQMDVLKKHCQQYVQHIIVAKTEGMNYEAKLMDLQSRIGERLSEMERGIACLKSDDDLMMNEVQDLKDTLARLTGQKPQVQVELKTLKADLPAVTFADLQCLMGTVGLSEEKTQLSDPSVPRQECPGEPPGAQNVDCHVSDSVPEQLNEEPPGAQNVDCHVSDSVPEQLNEEPPGAQNVDCHVSDGVPELNEEPPGAQNGDCHVSDGVPEQLNEDLPETDSQSEYDGKSVISVVDDFPSLSVSRASDTHDVGFALVSLELVNYVDAMNASAATNGHLHAEKLKLPKKQNVSDKETKKKRQSLCTNDFQTKKERRIVCKRGPLSEVNKMKGKEMIISKYQEMLATGAVESNKIHSNKWVSITTPPGSFPERWGFTTISAFAPRPDNKAWVLLPGQQDLGVLDENGNIHLTFHIGRSPKYLAVYGAKDVLVVHVSPKSVMLYTEEQKRYALFGRLNCKAIAATASGIAFAVGKGLVWVPIEGDLKWFPVCKNQKGHLSIVSLSILPYNGKTVICAADISKNLIHFFQQEMATEFTAYPSFGFDKRMNFLSRKQLRRRGDDPRKARHFKPVCITAHPSGFVAVLDSSSHSVYIIDARKIFHSGLNGMECVASVISQDRLCCGDPQTIAFSVGEREDEEEHPKLWVQTKSGHLYITRLVFLSW